MMSGAYGDLPGRLHLSLLADCPSGSSPGVVKCVCEGARQSRTHGVILANLRILLGEVPLPEGGRRECPRSEQVERASVRMKARRAKTRLMPGLGSREPTRRAREN